MRILVSLVALMVMVPWGSQAQCTISSNALAFGTFTGATLNGVGSVTVNCTSGTAYSVGASTGMYWTGGAYGRSMYGSAGGALGYNLFREPARSTLLGTSPGADTIAGIGNGTSQTVIIYGSVNAWAYNAPGTYTDTVTVYVYSSFPTVTASMPISTTELKSCIISASPLNFGVYTGAALSATTTLVVRCTNTTAYYVNLDNGQHSKCCWSNQMVGPSGKLLNYALFQDAAHTKLWQNTVNYDGQAGTGTGGNQPLTVYGQTFGGQAVAPGSYADTVIVTLTY